jgi:hypothetical protein
MIGVFENFRSISEILELNLRGRSFKNFQEILGIFKSFFVVRIPNNQPLAFIYLQSAEKSSTLNEKFIYCGCNFKNLFQMMIFKI